MNVALIFPGQGSQYVGMGKDIFDNFRIAKEVFEMVDDVLSEKLSDIIFNGPNELLTSTKYAQPAIMAVSVAFAKVVESELGKSWKKIAKCAAGHSLGEYSALCVANSLSFEDTVKLLKVRSSAMHEAAMINPGSMAACISIPLATIKNTLLEHQNYGICEIANDNSSQQVVISGSDNAISKVIEFLQKNSYKVIKLNVSGAFHSPLMKKASLELAKSLQKTPASLGEIPVIANYTANFLNSAEEIKECLIQQVQGTVRWRETIDLLERSGIETLIEIGPGNILSNMIKRDNRSFNHVSISNIDDLDKYLNSYSKSEQF